MRAISPIFISVCFILITVVFAIQFSQPNIIGADGYIHSYMAKEASSHWGRVPSLQQVYFSFFRTQYADKDFLYHMYLAPFVWIGGEIVGAKGGALMATSVLCIVVACVLVRGTNNNMSALWSLFLLVSAQFLRDTAEARPLIFALTCTVIGVHLIGRKKIILTGLLTIFFGMMHLSAWLLPFIACVQCFIDWLVDGVGDWRLPLITLVAYMMSFLLHPNFPNNLTYAYLNGVLVPIFAAKSGILELGAEFFPLNTSDLFVYFPYLVFGSLAISVLNMLGLVKGDKYIRTWGLSCGIMVLLGFISRRNLTHVYPVLIIFFGLLFNLFIKQIANESTSFKKRILPLSGVVFLCICGFSIVATSQALPPVLYAERVYAEHFTQVATQLQKNALKHDRVFHANWSDSQYLLGLAPQQEYIVTFDPIYMYAFNSQLYELYRQISFGKVSNPREIIIGSFGSKYVYAGKNYFTILIAQLKQDSKVQIVYEDELGVLFSL